MEFSSESLTCLDSEQSGEDSRQSSMTLVKIGNWPKADSNSSQFVTENVVENLNAKGKGKVRHSLIESARQTVLAQELRKENQSFRATGYSTRSQAHSTLRSNTCPLKKPRVLKTTQQQK